MSPPLLAPTIEDSEFVVVSHTWRTSVIAEIELRPTPARGQEAFTAVNDPVTTTKGTRVAGLRFVDTRAQALLHALLIFRLLPDGFTNRDLRALVGQLLDQTMSAGQLTYDLRRLRAHGLITRLPHSHRYHLTDTGLHDALFLTRAHRPFAAHRTGRTRRPRPQTPQSRQPQLPESPRQARPGIWTRSLKLDPKIRLRRS